MKTNSNTDILLKERTSIFETSLKLVREGKFQKTSLPEIALLSKMSERLMNSVYDSRDTLLKELSQKVSQQIIEVIEQACKQEKSFKENFFCVWLSLYNFYTQNPEMIAFIRQHENSAQEDALHFLHPARCKSLIRLFDNVVSPIGNAEALAGLFHANVAAAAGINALRSTEMPGIDPELLAGLFWDGLFCSTTSR